MNASSPNSEPTEELSEFLNALMLGVGPTLQDIADGHPEIILRLSKLDPIQVANTFGSLLTIPELQGNCLRIETLVHFALMVANGQASPTNSFVRAAFKALGDGFCGQAEDPPEDLFVGTVRSPRGNFLILEGIWEGNAFYLQRFLNVIEGMPKGFVSDDLKNSVYALLTLSNLVCERARLERHQVGAKIPARYLNAKALDNKSHAVRFSIVELEWVGIDPIMLKPFLFPQKNRGILPAEHIGFSSLERQPLIYERDHISLVLPTAISAAIRYYIIEWLDAEGMLSVLGQAIANEYEMHFSNLQVMGWQHNAPISFQFTDHGAFASVVSMIDKGRYLNIVFFTDNLAEFDQTGIAGINPDNVCMSEAIKKHIDDVYNQTQGTTDFIDGISLVVSCGVGRGSVLLPDQEDRPNWKVEFISAYDFDTLNWTPRFTALSLWRLLAAREHIKRLGVNLQNINGLLNLVAWARSLGGHLVQHKDLPDDFVNGGRDAWLMIPQNSQCDLRREVKVCHDVRVIQDIQGRWIPVRQDNQSDFADDKTAPLYVSEIVNDEGWLMSVYLAPVRAWWAEISVPKNTPKDVVFERWRLLRVWLSRMAPILDGLPGLPTGPVKWRAKFELKTFSGLRHQPSQRSYEEARNAITVINDPAAATVVTNASSIFEDAIFHHENIAEKALVDSLLEGVLDLAGASQEDRPNLLRSIVTSPQARNAHKFVSNNFRDFVAHKLQRALIKIDKDDDAAIRLGLGWMVRDRSLGGRLSGKKETIAYLNALVAAVEDGLCKDLRAFNQEALLKTLLFNHEAAAFDREHWRRTSAAILALHSDIESTLASISNNERELNAIFQSSRTLMEMVICESPLEGGREAGELALSRLMAKAALIFHIGGWSDAIRWDVMEPTIEITPLGDIHAKFDYVDAVIAPHIRESSDVRTREAADRYAENLEQVESITPVSDLLDQQFLDAWREEFGTTFQEMRIFVDWLENRGIEFSEPVMCLKLADFKDVGTEAQALSPEVVTKLLDKLTLVGRLSWRDVPEGFDDRDRQPWRFRRRLSVLRSPILKIGSGEAERYLVAPGMVRDSFSYLARNYIHGDFPPNQLGSKMKAWGGREAHARGTKFSQAVLLVLQELGWEVQIEVTLTKILRRQLDRDYGDVDVLAWSPDEQRILIIECKDVQFKKTYGEICEQLADFRGELRSNGKPDYLRRHLDRIDVLREYISDVASYLKLTSTDPILESHLVFKNPVPMKYALKKLAERVTVSLFDEIANWKSPLQAGDKTK